METLNNQPKILIVLYYYHPYTSGVSVYAKRLAEGLNKRGYEVTVIASQHQKDLPLNEIINGINVIRVPYLFKFDKGVIMPSFALKIRRLAKSHAIVNMHLPLAESGLISLLVAKDKLITTYQCDIKLSPKLLSKIIEKVSYTSMNMAAKRSRSLVALSLDYAQSSKVLSKYLDKTVEIIAPIDIDRFVPQPSTEIREKLKVAPSSIVIGFVGRIVYEKGLSYLLGSLNYLSKENVNFSCLIAGEYEEVAGGSIKDQLDKHLGVDSNVSFTGYLSDEELVSFYNLCDVLILPSIDPLEAFGMVQVEAMLCGTPVVATDMPGVRQPIKRTGMGLLVPPKNEKEIAGAIQKILEDPKKYIKTRDHVIDKMELYSTFDSYQDLISKIENNL